MAPLEGKITPAGSGSHPTAPRLPIPGADEAPRFRSEGVPPGSPPAIGPRGGLASPPAGPGPESPELADLKALAAAHAEEAKIRRLERKAALARERAQHEARERAVQEREERVTAIEKRLQAYKNTPHLAIQDLASFGVTPEQLIQAIADGRASPEQLAAADAALAREDVQRLRAEVTERERAAGERDRAARAAAQRDAERQVVADWKAGASKVVEAAKDRFPLVARTLARGSVDVVFEQADRIFTHTGKEPSFEEAIQAAESQLQQEWAEIAGAGGAPPPSPGRAATPSPREPSGSAAQDRRAWFLRMLDDKLKGLR